MKVVARDACPECGEDRLLVVPEATDNFSAGFEEAAKQATESFQLCVTIKFRGETRSVCRNTDPPAAST